MRDSLVLFLNGRRHEIADAWAAATLAEWLRERQGLTATKVVCSEGDCGACSVLVGRLDAASEGLVYRAIDSCIAFLYQLDRTHVVTVEGLSPGGELSPVQEAMVACHGSQCGFCTPGFVATLHGLFEGDGVSADADAPLADEELRYGLSGNLCRCTGYVQILEAGQAVDPAAVKRIGELYDPRPIVAKFAQLAATGVAFEFEGPEGPCRVSLPAALDEAVAERANRPDARLICGGTDLGVQRNHGRVQLRDVICLAHVAEFDRVVVEDDQLILGAGATWRQVERAVREPLPELWRILTRFGSPQIRNMGTVGGNLVNASPIADSLPAFYVLEATVHLASLRGVRTVPIAQFYLGYKKLDLKPDELLTEVRVPLPRVERGELLRLDKVSKRRDMDISTVASAVWLRVEDDVIAEARFAFGGVGPVVLRCRQAEAAAIGRPLCEESLRTVGGVARREVTPISDVRGGEAYRSQLVENLLAKAGRELALALALTEA